ncbi:hypothetical protein ERJ75_000158600 [Trypanosoma vivax]|uniref:Uncharacterized protein n=1 Tax=Trypanosoma vivax (strain Y486) TaxID=1055687 RepID=F9WQX9_TRYVY|nr:hypothetical protein TRVL_08929 [Trypanosoma vivax]KAH8619505.1 hypothetical protein ERJ75_000158600 [Trypanosoma vivax]CCD19961.1 hypothetical protein, conserved in T. vivax [Trypanosoma vivax Y486]|eukprot:CCD19961.1 hypothetical protein, conserved in T. vivax [Trypanosoma vivax Y486]
MKVCSLALFALAVAASVVEGGSPLKYTKEVDKVCQFYHGMLLLSDTTNVRKLIKGSDCGDCCVNDISFYARSLRETFAKSYKYWENCGEYPSKGCCLGVESTTYLGKETQSLWSECFLYSQQNGEAWDGQVEKFVTEFLSTGEMLKTWKNGVNIELEKGDTNCEYTEGYYGWSGHSGVDFGGLFNVEVGGYFWNRATMKLDRTVLESGSLHELLCLLSRTTYGQGMRIHIGGCKGVCVEEKHLSHNDADTSNDADETVNNNERDNENQDEIQTSDESPKEMESDEPTKREIVEDKGTAGAFDSKNGTPSARTQRGIASAVDGKLKGVNGTETRAVEAVRAALVNSGVYTTHKVAAVLSLWGFITRNVCGPRLF